MNRNRKRQPYGIRLQLITALIKLEIQEQNESFRWLKLVNDSIHVEGNSFG